MATVEAGRLKEICERYGVVRLELFGSSVRGEAGADSDVDLLYTLAPDTHLGWEIEDLEAELAAAFGRPVDLVSRRFIHPRIREQVLTEARPLYAA
jgi:uncharacterized protein